MPRASFVAAVPYQPSHPSALALYCSDGRFTEAVEELFRSLGHERLDTLTMPGGPGLFNVWIAGMGDSTAITGGARFLIEAHAIKRVLLIAHEGCGFYRTHMAGRTAEQIKTQQLDDLQVATRALASARAGLRIDAYYAMVVGDRVSFTPLDRI
jgi:hypothetical protein